MPRLALAALLAAGALACDCLEASSLADVQACVEGTDDAVCDALAAMADACVSCESASAENAADATYLSCLLSSVEELDSTCAAAGVSLFNEACDTTELLFECPICVAAAAAGTGPGSGSGADDSLAECLTCLSGVEVELSAECQEVMDAAFDAVSGSSGEEEPEQPSGPPPAAAALLVAASVGAVAWWYRRRRRMAQLERTPAAFELVPPTADGEDSQGEDDMEEVEIEMGTV